MPRTAIDQMFMPWGGYNSMLERHLGDRVTAIVHSNFYWAPSADIADLLAKQAS